MTDGGAARWISADVHDRPRAITRVLALERDKYPRLNGAGGHAAVGRIRKRMQRREDRKR